MEEVDININDTLKNQIIEAKSILKVLESLTSNGEIYKTLFEEIGEKIEKSFNDLSKEKGLNTKYGNDLKKSKEKIDRFIDESKNTISELKIIEKTIRDLEKKSLTKSIKIEEIRNLSISLKKEVEDKKKEINKLFLNLSKISEKSSNFLAEIKKDKISSNNIMKLLEKIQEQAEKNLETLKGYLKDGKETFDKIKSQSSIINDFEKLSSKNNLKIQEYFDNLMSSIGEKTSIKEEIGNILLKIKSHQETIDKQVNVSTANRLCNAFQDKVLKLEKELKFWKHTIFTLTTALIIINILLILISPILGLWDIEFNLGITEHIGIIIPLAILFGFSIFEHSRIKKILDEYSFKYISSFSMPAYFELLEGKNKEEATKFLIDTIKDIYKNPSNKINIDSKITILDYLGDIFGGFSKVLGKNNISIPEINLKGGIGDLNIEISKIKNNSK